MSNSDLDTAVQRLLDHESRAAKVRRAPKAKRKEIKRQQARNRVSYDLDPVVTDLVTQVAEKEQVSKSSAVNLLLADAIIRYASGKIEFEPHKRVSESPKWLYFIALVNMAELLDELKAQGVEHW